MPISTRQELIDYALRKLGSPVIKINVDPDQIEDRLDDALEYMQEYSGNFYERTFLKHVVTQDNIDNKRIDMNAGASDSGLDPNNLIVSIARAYNITDSTISKGFDSVEYQIFLNDVYPLNHQGIIEYVQLKQHIAHLNFQLNPQHEVFFNRYRNIIELKIDWSQMKVGDIIVFEVYRLIDPSSATEIYGDRLLKAYLVELIREQWAQNMSKYSNVQLIGGVSINAEQMLSDARERIRDLQERIQLESDEMPIGDIG